MHTIGEVAACPKERLVAMLGKHGAQLSDYATGKEHSPVRPAVEERTPKSVGNGSTFPTNLQGRQEIRQGLSILADQVGARLRRYGFKGTTLQVTLRDPEFHDKSRQQKLDVPTQISREILRIAMELVEEFWDFHNPVRAMTITAASLIPEKEAGEQLDLFQPHSSQKHDKQEKLEHTMDHLRSKYGKTIISFADRVKQADILAAGDDEEE